MKTVDHNLSVILILLGAISLISLALYFKDFKSQDTINIKDFPRTIEGWVSQEIPLSKEELAILETDNVFVRKYTNVQGQNVYLYLVYSQTNRKVSHPPEICYTGSGITVLEKNPDTILVGKKVIHVNRLLLQSHQLEQLSFYWFKVGEVMTSSYWKQQILVAINSLLNLQKGSALIRISADIKSQNRAGTEAIIKEFSSMISPYLMKYLP